MHILYFNFLGPRLSSNLMLGPFVKIVNMSFYDQESFTFKIE